MIKTLKITSILTWIVAAGLVIFVAASGLRADPQMEDLLKKPGAAEAFRQMAGSKPAALADTTSPLVKQAQAFALRINPPPPLPPPPKEGQPPAETVKVIVPPPPAPPARFNLLGTAFYRDHPEESLALINTISEGNKWFRQGEQIGRLVIQQINEGNVVLFQDGREHSRLNVPEQKGPSLLKSTGVKYEVPAASVVTLPSEPAHLPPTETLPVQPALPPTDLPAVTDVMTEQTQTGQPIETVTEQQAELTDEQVFDELTAEQQKQFLEQQKQMIDENIAEVEKMMAMMDQDSQDRSEQLKQQEQAGLRQLLEILLEEKKKLEGMEKIQASEPNKPEEPS